MNDNKATLWLDSSRSRYFLIPDQHPLPSGDFLIWSPVGGQKKVDPTALPSFEVSAEVAKEHLGLDVSQAFQQVKAIFANFVTFLTQNVPSETPERTIPTSDFWRDLLGVSLAELQNNPEVARATLIKLATNLQEVMAGATSEDPAQLEAARDRMRHLQAALHAQGVDVSENLEKLPDHLHNLHLYVDQEQHLKAGAAQLQTLIDRLEQSQASGQSLEELHRSLLENFKDIFVQEDEAQRREQKMQAYRQSARRAIDAAVEARAPAINFKGLIDEAKQRRTKKDNPQE